MKVVLLAVRFFSFETTLRGIIWCLPEQCEAIERIVLVAV